MLTTRSPPRYRLEGNPADLSTASAKVSAQRSLAIKVLSSLRSSQFFFPLCKVQNSFAILLQLYKVYYYCTHSTTATHILLLLHTFYCCFTHHTTTHILLLLHSLTTTTMAFALTHSAATVDWRHSAARTDFRQSAAGTGFRQSAARTGFQQSAARTDFRQGARSVIVRLGLRPDQAQLGTVVHFTFNLVEPTSMVYQQPSIGPGAGTTRPSLSGPRTKAGSPAAFRPPASERRPSRPNSTDRTGFSNIWRSNTAAPSPIVSEQIPLFLQIISAAAVPSKQPHLCCSS